MEHLKKLIKQAESDFSKCTTLSALDHSKAKYFGKESAITESMKTLSSLAKEDKPKAGAFINEIKSSIEQVLENRKTEIQLLELSIQLEKEAIDITLPGKKQNKGTLHPITISMERIENIFHSVGFSSTIGPEIEDDYHNFTALNIPCLLYTSDAADE